MGARVLAAAVALIVAWPSFGTAQDAGSGGGDERYTVAYVDVQPSAKTTLTAAFARYRDASRTERGFRAFELFEQTGRPGHFVLIENWQDQASLDAHAAAPAVKALHAALDPIRTSGYDQRPYKALSTVSTGRRPPRDAVWVISHVDIGGPGVDAAALLRREAAASRQDPGCLQFNVLQHTMRANHFTVIEAWSNQRAYEAHAASAHSRQYRDDLQPGLGSPLDERAFTAVE
jgi:quinol monooxygenase YgiN